MKVLQVSLLIVVVSLANIALAEEGLCPGATVDQYAAGVSDCRVPQWNYWYFSNEILLPSRDPTRFYQTTTDAVAEMRCAPGTCFSQVEQLCVHYYEWRNPCVIPEIIPETETNAPEPSP